MKQKEVSFIIAGVLIALAIGILLVTEDIRFTGLAVDDLGGDCSAISCSPTYLTDHGTFYGYCDGVCRVADGINGNFDELNWCQKYITAPLASYSHWTHYWTGSEYIDFLGWDPDPSLSPRILCEDLFYGTLPEDVGENGFRGGYNYRGQQTQIRDEQNVTIEDDFYDTLGYGAQYGYLSSASGLVESLIDPLGRLHQTIDQEGNVMKNTYDGLDRVIITEYFLPSNLNTPDFTVQYFYDSLQGGATCSSTGKSFNLLCAVVDDTGSTSFLYDERDRVVLQRKKITTFQFAQRGNEREYVLGFEYDVADNLKEMSLPDGTLIKYYYDGLGQLVRIERVKNDGSVEELSTLDYTATGQIVRKGIGPSASPNFITADYYYDNKQQLVGFQYTKSGVPIFQRSMQYDLLGNIEKIGYGLDVSNPEILTNSKEVYAYDSLSRLKSANYEGDKSFVYGYGNMLGDRVTKAVDGVVTEYSYVTGNRLDFYGPVAQGAGTATNLGYDDSGNILIEASSDRIASYRYDSLNRLASSTTNGKTSNYFYDYTNKRNMKVTTEGTTFYLYHGNNVIFEEYFKNPIICSDGTLAGQCSGNNYCTADRTFIEKCEVCGCSGGAECSKGAGGYSCGPASIDDVRGGDF